MNDKQLLGLLCRGLTVQEIADLTGKSKSTVSLWIKRLKKNLGDEHKGP